MKDGKRREDDVVVVMVVGRGALEVSVFGLGMAENE